ncbi:CBS domain-containing protein [Nitrosomonas communis]|uniref:CBS domain-containing protein n=1 Tax=Nitrosomonas communis TaxID=44574 RepID=A0A1I4WW92_9PROT|nr:CBS domain-containing protein [Nitrosomonas communis]SFN17757.1 CBS domain-containing protein [Nitrosomonas communis]
MQTVSDVMNTNVQVISPEATLHEAAQHMRDGDFGVLPVGDMDNLIGIITDRDIVVRAVAEGMDINTPVRDAMSEQIVFVNQDDSLEDAARLMSDHQIRRLPVVDADDHLVGIVSIGDFAVESSDLAPVTEALSDISTPT